MLVKKECNYCEKDVFNEKEELIYNNLIHNHFENYEEIAVYIKNSELFTAKHYLNRVLEDDETNELAISSTKINFCPMCGRQVNKEYEPEIVEQTTIFDL